MTVERPAGGYPSVEKVLMIFADIECKRNLKVINREVNLAMPTVTQYLDWANTPITFDKSDHPRLYTDPRAAGSGGGSSGQWSPTAQGPDGRWQRTEHNIC